MNRPLSADRTPVNPPARTRLVPLTRENVEDTLYGFDQATRIVVLRRWAYEYSPRRWCRKWFERARKGWSVEDTFDFDGYLAGVIAGGVRSLREYQHGHPEGVTFEEWGEILEEIVTGFTIHANDAVLMAGSAENQAALEAKYERAKRLFAYWFGHLWD